MIGEARKNYYASKGSVVVKIQYRKDEEAEICQFNTLALVIIGRRKNKDFQHCSYTIQHSAGIVIDNIIEWLESNIGKSDLGINASIRLLKFEKEEILHGQQSNIF